MGVLYGGGGDKGFLTSTDLYQSLNMLPSKPMKGSFPSSHPGAEFILQKVKNWIFIFYENLTQSLNPVISFEKAQKQMRETYPTRPDLWAGFVLVR